MASDDFSDSIGDMTLVLISTGLFLGLIWAFITIFESCLEIAIGLIVFGIILGIITKFLSTYEATANNDKIQDIKVTGYSDTPKMAEVAFNNLIKTIKETQDLEVDGIAGATHSSNGLKSAVAMAVQASGVKL